MRRVKVLLTLCMISLLSIGSFGRTTHAAEVDNSPFSFDNRTESGYGSWRPKTNTTKVYVYPQSGPKIFYTIQGKTGEYGTVANRSNMVAIPQGVEGSVTNTVCEAGNTYARLKFQRITTGYVMTSGVWSPDSTRNYTIYN